jgi:plastocyanin
MRNLVRASLLLLAVVAVACSQPGSTSTINPTAASSVQSAQGGGGASTATVVFGNDSVGSHFPPPSGHDASGNARDNLIPQTVVIDKGGTVTFKMGFAGVHQVAIYKPGVEPEDIDTSIVKFPPTPPCPPVPIINDPTDREVFLGTQICQSGASVSTLQYKFDRPGKYLVICAFLPHFNSRMYGWVIVRDR